MQSEKLTEIHVVVGVEGEYSDRSEWEVCAYPSRELADEHAMRATEAGAEVAAKLRAMDDDEDSYTDEWDKRREVVMVNPWDATGQFSGYDEPGYHAVTIPLLHELPKVEADHAD